MSAQPAAMMCEQQRKSIYGYARELGMSTRSADGDDELHVLVAGITGKDSLKLLKYAEAEKVLAELKHRGRFGGAARPPAQTSRKRTDEGGKTKLSAGAGENRIIKAFSPAPFALQTEKYTYSIPTRIALTEEPPPIRGGTGI